METTTYLWSDMVDDNGFDIENVPEHAVFGYWDNVRRVSTGDVSTETPLEGETSGPRQVPPCNNHWSQESARLDSSDSRPRREYDLRERLTPEGRRAGWHSDRQDYPSNRFHTQPILPPRHVLNEQLSYFKEQVATLKEKLQRKNLFLTLENKKRLNAERLQKTCFEELKMCDQQLKSTRASYQNLQNELRQQQWENKELIRRVEELSLQSRPRSVVTSSTQTEDTFPEPEPTVAASTQTEFVVTSVSASTQTAAVETAALSVQTDVEEPALHEDTADAPSSSADAPQTGLPQRPPSVSKKGRGQFWKRLFKRKQ